MTTDERANRLQAEIDAAWQMIEQGWDIESREELERQAATNGFKFGLAQAVHHMWKRCVKENPAFLRSATPAAPALTALPEKSYLQGYASALIDVIAKLSYARDTGTREDAAFDGLNAAIFAVRQIKPPISAALAPSRATEGQ